MGSVTNAAKTAPLAVRAALFVLTLQIAFTLVGLVFLTAMVVAEFEPDRLLIPLFLTALVVPACWASARSRRREPWVRWAIVGVEAWWAGAFLLLNAIDPGLDWGRVLGPGTLGPLAVVVLLLLPPAGRWFRTAKAVTNQDG